MWIKEFVQKLVCLKWYLVNVKSKWQQADSKATLWTTKTGLRTYLQGLYCQLIQSKKYIYLDAI